MTTTPAKRDERELFEAEILDSNEDPDLDRRADGDYCNIYLQQAWCGWQQRAALAESELAEVRGENAIIRLESASFLETMAKTCELLDIDLEDAKHADGKPSDILFSHAQKLREERDELRAELERGKADAQRYQKLRAMRWNESPMAVVNNPKQCVMLGSDCPSDERLDEALDLIEPSHERQRCIVLTKAEIQSGYDRVEWAEGLIRQLPEDHDGRNSWLLNYAIGAGEGEAR